MLFLFFIVASILMLGGCVSTTTRAVVSTNHEEITESEGIGRTIRKSHRPIRKAKEQGAQTLEEQDKAIYELYVEDTGRGWETWLEERMCPLARTYIVG